MATNDDLTPLSPQDAAGLLRATLEAVKAEVGALSQAQLRWRPAPDAWCVNEVLGHLIEAERRGFAGRIRLILAQSGPLFETWDQPAVAQARGDCARDGYELLREFEQVRQDSLDLVAQLTHDQLDRSGRHPTVGMLRVRDLLHEWIFHDRAHVKQILDNVGALMWPHMGNSRRFSQPELPEL
ncbi:MAG TPA: DinB family protein [Roseiflexaceae bacterium]